MFEAHKILQSTKHWLISLSRSHTHILQATVVAVRAVYVSPSLLFCCSKAGRCVCIGSELSRHNKPWSSTHSPAHTHTHTVQCRVVSILLHHVSVCLRKQEKQRDRLKLPKTLSYPTQRDCDDLRPLLSIISTVSIIRTFSSILGLSAEMSSQAGLIIAATHNLDYVTRWTNFHGTSYTMKTKT